MTVTTVAAVPISSLAGSLPAATRFGPNLYATAAAGAHLPAIAERLLEANAHSPAPAERIVLKAQAGSAPLASPSSDEQQLNRLAERFAVQIDVRHFGQVQEFIPASMRAKMAATGVMLAAKTTAPKDLASQIAQFLQSTNKATASRRAHALRHRSIEGIAALLAIRSPFELRYHSHKTREAMTSTDIGELRIHLEWRSPHSTPNRFRSKEYHLLSEVRKASERALEQVDAETISSLLTHPDQYARFGAISRLLWEFDYHTRGIRHDIAIEFDESFRDVENIHIPAARALAKLLLKQSLTDPNEDIRDYIVSVIGHDLARRPMRFKLVWKELLRDAPEPLRQGAREISRRIRIAK